MQKLQHQLPRNDPRQYDELVDTWWDPHGSLAMLHWIAEARARLIPPAPRPGEDTLVDLGCGGGLMAPYVTAKGYRHVGVDITLSALTRARQNGVSAVNGDVLRLPFADESAAVVCAGEIFEHVVDLPAAIAESCRVLRPGGVIVIDTIADTAIARFVAITLGERVKGGAPAGLHDPSLFVDRRQLVDCCANHGVRLELRGLRPSILQMVAWLAGRRSSVNMVHTRSTAVLFQAWGTKA